MGIIRRIIFIIVLLGLAFVFYRFINPDWADRLISKLRWIQIEQTISNIQDQNLVSTWTNLTWGVDTWIVNTWIILTWKVSTWIVKVWSVQTWLQASWETIWLVDNMSGFSEVIDATTSKKLIKWDLNYKNSDYNFSMTFPWSWDGYTIETFTWKEFKAQLVFSFDSKDYFILYVVSNSYYETAKSLELAAITYLTQNSSNTFAYKILENTDLKSKAIPYILKTFKLTNSIPNTITPIKQIPSKVKQPTKTTTVKKKTSSDWNYLKNIFDSFVK